MMFVSSGIRLGSVLHTIIEYLDPKKLNNNTKDDSITKHIKQVIWWMNKVDENRKTQEKYSHKGGMKFYLLYNNRYKERNP